MLWPLLTMLALLALIGVHGRWHARFRRAQEEASRERNALRETHERAALRLRVQQETAFNSMVEGLLLLDENGRIQFANRAFHQGFDIAADVGGRTIMEAVRWHELAEVVESLGGDQAVLSRELKWSGPPERWVEVNAAAVTDGSGGRRGTILVFHDLTRLKRLERARQEFVANVSHELRTPLSLIKGYVETLLEGAKDNPEFADKFLRTVARNAERLRLLIEDLLTISELESGHVKLNLQTISLRSLSEKVVADFRGRAAARQVTLSDGIAEVSVRADPGRIEQVLCNLVDNAIKYGRPGGHVVISARDADHEWVEIAVRDDGPGLPPEALDRVFERFYRVDKGRSREQGGTGLGLSIVKHIVQSHGGKAWVSSQPGQGATFYFTLPRADAGAATGSSS